MQDCSSKLAILSRGDSCQFHGADASDRWYDMGMTVGKEGRRERGNEAEDVEHRCARRGWSYGDLIIRYSSTIRS